MNFIIPKDDLIAALAALEQAEKNGFKYCETIFELQHYEPNLERCYAKYSDLWERAHPTNGRLDWGRFQNITTKHKFVKGKLVPNDSKTK